MNIASFQPIQKRVSEWVSKKKHFFSFIHDIAIAIVIATVQAIWSPDTCNA